MIVVFFPSLSGSFKKGKKFWNSDFKRPALSIAAFLTDGSGSFARINMEGISVLFPKSPRASRELASTKAELELRDLRISGKREINFNSAAIMIALEALALSSLLIAMRIASKLSLVFKASRVSKSSLEPSIKVSNRVVTYRFLIFRAITKPIKEGMINMPANAWLFSRGIKMVRIRKANPLVMGRIMFTAQLRALERVKGGRAFRSNPKVES